MLGTAVVREENNESVLRQPETIHGIQQAADVVIETGQICQIVLAHFLIGNRTEMTYYPGTIGLPDAASPRMCNKSWTITAEIEVPDPKAEGMVITHGGLEGGYGLYLKGGKPTFVYNFLSVQRSTFAAKGALPKGKTTLVVDFKYDGGGMGKGGQITMRANGKTIAEGRLERTIPIQFSLGEGVDVGLDVGSPIDFTYKLPFAFTGKIEKVTVKLGQADIGSPKTAKTAA